MNNARGVGAHGGMPGESCTEPTTYEPLPVFETAPSITSSSVAPRPWNAWRPSFSRSWSSHAEMRCGGSVGGSSKSASHWSYDHGHSPVFEFW